MKRSSLFGKRHVTSRSIAHLNPRLSFYSNLLLILRVTSLLSFVCISLAQAEQTALITTPNLPLAAIPVTAPITAPVETSSSPLPPPLVFASAHSADPQLDTALLNEGLTGWHFGANLNFELPLPLENGGLPQNRLTTREAAIHAHGMIDQVIEAYLNFRAHDDPGSFLFEMREAWVASHIDESHENEFKIGKFALTIDAVNPMRPFQRPFITSPFIQSTFVAKDQELDAGLEYHWHHEVSTHALLSVFAGLASGYCYGDCSPLNNGERPLVPVYYAHPNFELRWGNSTSASGLTYLGFKDADSTATQLIGLDEMWTSGVLQSGPYTNAKWILLTEWFFRSKFPNALPVQNQEGAFLLLGHAFSSRLSTNLRLEFFTEPTLRDSDGNRRSNLTEGISPFVAYKTTSHTELRGQYSWSQMKQNGSSTNIGQAFALQLVADLGDPDIR